MRRRPAPAREGSRPPARPGAGKDAKTREQPRRAESDLRRGFHAGMSMTTITRLPVPSGEDPGPESGFGLAAPADTALDLRRILSILKRRKVMILGVMFVVTSLAALVVSQLTPLYRAEVTLVVESNRQNIAPIQAVVQ